jgi:hypothetical protein
VIGAERHNNGFGGDAVGSAVAVFVNGWWDGLLAGVQSAVAADAFWSEYVRQANKEGGPSLHLAVLVEPFLGYLLSGQKTIESRFSIHRCAPYGQVNQGDVLVLKAATGPVVGMCLVDHVWSFSLDTTPLTYLRDEFGEALCANDDFWTQRGRARYATLMRVQRVRSLPPIVVRKRDRRGWVVFRRGPQQTSLLEQFDAP